MNRKLSTVLALLAVGLVAAPATATAQVGHEEVPAPGHAWSITPADDERVSFRFQLEPGEEITDGVEVVNYSDREVTFALVASDGVVGPDGAFDLLASDEEPVDTGSWIEIEDSVTIPAEASAVVPFTLSVPEDALPGDHPGGIAASIAGAGEDAVLVDSRVGARIHLRISGDVAATLGIADVTATYRPSWNPFVPGELDLSWTVANEGNVRLGATTTARSDGLLGADADTAGSETVREILPHDVVQQSVTVPAWPLGPLAVEVVTEPNIVGQDAVEVPLSAAAGHVALWAVPWLHLGLLVLAVVLVLGQMWRRRRRAESIAAAVAAAREEGSRATGAVRGGDAVPVSQ